MPVTAFASLAWSAVVLPGSATPVRLARLPRAADAGFRVFVAFPAGWTRPEAGHYPVAEEFLVLEGDLRLNDATWRAGGYARIPAHRLRSVLHSKSGCLVFAWFAAAPDWIPGAAAAAPSSDEVGFAHWRNAPDRALGGGASGHRLYAGPEHDTWIVPRRHAAVLAVPGRHWETLGLRGHGWHSDATPASGDDPDEPLLLRVW
jgi:hypothetical protein